MAAQYLAAAGISFLEAKEDDSHTNLGFSEKAGCLSSRPLNTRGDTLLFSYRDFSLQWQQENTLQNFVLDGKSHESVLDWIRARTRKAGFKEIYTYSFHYDFIYEVEDRFTFELRDEKRLHDLEALRSKAQAALREFLLKENLFSEIRIWPHHFDTGAYTRLPGEQEFAVGLGLAVPDTICDDHYFYISGYKGGMAIDCTNFKALSRGEWKHNGFNGAVLPATSASEELTMQFLHEAMDTYKEAIA